MIKSLRWKTSALILIDAMLINLAYILAYNFRFENNIPEVFMIAYRYEAFLVTVIYILCFMIFKLYKSLWTYASIDEFILGVEACAAAGLMNFIYSYFNRQIPLSIGILAAIFTTILVVGFRISFRILRRFRDRLNKRKCKDGERVMVIGAGSAGSIIINEMKNSKETNLYPVCIIDDDKKKIGTTVSGVPIVGDRFTIDSIAKKKNVDLILMAIPSLGRDSKKELINICKSTGRKIKTIPGIYELLNGDVSIKKIRDVSPEELLGKIPVKVDDRKIRDYIEGKKVLVAGGSGTVGSELCRQIAKYSPKALIVLDIYENSAYDLQNELKSSYGDLDLRVVTGSVTDRRRLEQLFQDYKPEVIFHAAAYKHAPLVEESPAEAIKNNVYGTLNIAEIADQYGTEKFVLVSDDKAVNPTNIIGAADRICEMIVQSIDKKSKTNFSAVRFGNVFGSNGSIVPLFKRQINQGGPVIVSHKDLTRFFMTINEASQLIIQAGAMASGGEVFVLDMGNPVRIYDLAKDLIKLSGLEPDKDIEIKITGLEPGEKLHEEVLTDEEGLNKTAHDKIFASRTVFDNFNSLKEKLDNLKFVLEKGNKRIITDNVLQTVKDLVPNYYNPVFDETAASKALYDTNNLIDSISTPKRIFLASPHMDGIEKEYVKDAFDTNWIAPLGPHVDGFENEVASMVHISAAAAMTSGTAAIHMALRSLNIKKDDIVFCSTLTFSASCNPIMYEGAKPVFIDSERESWNMSPIALQKAIDEYEKKGKLPKAVIVVNLYGQSADYDELKSICDKYGVPIVEDAAESLGATYKGKFTGTIGKYGVYSFNGNKIITTSGGGMLVSDDELSIKKVRFYITQARDQARHYQHSELGFNYRMSNVLAGIGRGQLKVLNQRIMEKKNIYEYYKKSFSEIEDIEMMPVASFGKPNYWLSVMTIKEESKVKPIDVMVALEKESIESRPVWKPMHLQPFYMDYDFYSHNDEGISVSEDLFNRGVCLPSDTKMSLGEMERVSGIVKGLWG